MAEETPPAGKGWDATQYHVVEAGDALSKIAKKYYGDASLYMGLGVAGSLVANLLGGALGRYGEGHQAGIIGSTVGAILILLVYRLFKGKGGAGAAKSS